MGRRMSTVVLFLLVVAVVLGGLAGCSRQAEEREAQATEPSATEGADLSLSEEGATGTPKVTVVSAVTSAPGTDVAASGGQPTTEPAGEAAAAVEPTATTAPVASPLPAATAPATSATGEDYVVHTVKRGETLSAIALQYGTTTRAIVKANNLSDPSKIITGQKLKIPTSEASSSGSTGGQASGQCSYKHTVKKGEWIWQIARKYKVSPYDIMEANGLTRKTANTIHAGKVLCIP